ncbi:MAG TPA: aromatic acid exporter family protein, partial [Bacillota bacterium]|nr:aromatic acid exporter family protein [Bacillota bacterium]
MGARLIKTGIAVTVAAAICHLLQIPTIFAAMSAVLNMKPSVVQSWKNALEQLLVHLVGLFTAFVIGLTLGANPLTIGLTTMVVIWLIARLDLTSGTLMGVLSAVFILSSSSEDFFLKNALIRSGAILIGLAVALVVNYFI